LHIETVIIPAHRHVTKAALNGAFIAMKLGISSTLIEAAGFAVLILLLGIVDRGGSSAVL
jgi:hypothetical protein